MIPLIKDKGELWALALLKKIIKRDREDRDALPGSVVKHVKDVRSGLSKNVKTPGRSGVVGDKV